MSKDEKLKLEQLQRELKWEQDQKAKLEKRCAELQTSARTISERNSDLQQENIRLNQSNRELLKDFKHAHTALKLYDAAAAVFDKARSEAYNVKDK